MSPLPRSLLIVPCITAFGLPFAMTCAADAVPDLCLSPNGSDKATGRADAPLATLDAARLRVRELRKAQPDRATPVVVALHGGTYFLDRTFVLDPEDSGTAASPTIYTASPDEQPVVSAGRRITGWTHDQKGWWTTRVPEVATGSWNFCQLFVDDVRKPRPRVPKQGYAHCGGMIPGTTETTPVNVIGYQGTDIRADWAQLTDVEVIGFRIWTIFRSPIARVDDKGKLVYTARATHGSRSWEVMKQGNRMIVENVKEALGTPGEWYLDRPSGVLTYVPEEGQKNPAQHNVIAPYLDRIVELRGRPEKREWVRHVVFRNIQFSHANWNAPRSGTPSVQAEVDIEAALTATGARDCVFDHCAVTHVGGYGIELGSACRGNRVESCDLLDLGGGGVKLGPLGIEHEPELVSRANVVRECFIGHGGRLHPAAIGVFLGETPDNVVEHNEIFDLYYTGISAGWVWGYGASINTGNQIRFNHIHHIGYDVLSDNGGIYTLGGAAGTVLSNNVIHDINSFDYGGWGIYFDEGTANIVAEDNLVYRTKEGSFHQHYGRDNTVRNNILAFSGKWQVQRSRIEPHTSFTFENNIVLWDSGVLLNPGPWQDIRFVFNKNLYWRSDGAPFDFAGRSFAQWREAGLDVQGLVADPLFIDPAKDDFRLKQGSPAEKIGFRPFDATQAGPRRTCTTVIPAVPHTFPVGK